jgi:glucokinase
MQGGRPAVAGVSLPSCGDDLERSLATIVEGFGRVREQAPAPPVAISFAFPGPADYAEGIIVGPRNLPAYRDVPLGPMLEDRFGLPTFINNDGDLFACGEAAAGLLPAVNQALAEAGSPKRFRNLFGVTIGTGFGGGVVRDGALHVGDNSGAGEVWLFRHKGLADVNVEEGASIRAVRRVYAEVAGIAPDAAPEPRQIHAIAEGRAEGHGEAAREAFRRLGEVVGDAIAIASTLLDGLVVIGGGIAAAYTQFLPAVVAEMNAAYRAPNGERFRRLVPRAFNLEDPADRAAFLAGEPREVAVPGSARTIRFDALARIGVGISRLGTSEATAVGAYAYALSRLDRDPGV